MNRRTFLIRSGVLISGASLAGGGTLTGCFSPHEIRVLSRHIVDRVEFGEAGFHWPRLVGKNARIGVHGQYKKARYARLYTSQGAEGWGMLSYGDLGDEERLKQTLLGKRVNQLINPPEGIAEGVHPAFDIALHDLAGVILEQPVYRMLGANGPKEQQVYSGMIYLDELEPEDNPAGIDKVLENCRWDVDYGYRQLKVKIGRSGRWYSHDEGLATDIRIVKRIQEEFGDRVEILVDANDMYSLQDTIDFLEGVGDVPIYWMEEPFVENLGEGRKLKQWMLANGRENTFYADGEREPDFEVCRQLAREKILDVYLPDVIGYGFTPWRRLMPSLKTMGTLASPHAWGSLLKTHYAAHLSAGLGNVCTLEGVTCLSDDIDFGDYPIVDGKLRVSEKPGFGMKLINTK
jgi:D-galactarolactone cycloisomerase